MSGQTNYPGIDYSGIGSKANRDTETGIRYGVVSQNSVIPEALEDIEFDYGKPHCPDCGKEVAESNPEQGRDYFCPDCGKTHWTDRCFPDEALGWSYQQDGYKLCDCLENDIFVILSPYFTYAQFCSPCVPGACNLDSPLEQSIESNRCFCLGHDWFEGGKAPYKVYSVETGKEVAP